MCSQFYTPKGRVGGVRDARAAPVRFTRSIAERRWVTYDDAVRAHAAPKRAARRGVGGQPEPDFDAALRGQTRGGWVGDGSRDGRAGSDPTTRANTVGSNYGDTRYSAIELVTGFPPSIGFMDELPKLTEREASDAQKLRGIPSEGMRRY